MEGTSSSTGSSFSGLRHTYSFHNRPDQHLSTYTVFHGSPTFEGTGRPSPYASIMARRDPHAPSGFTATSQKFIGPDGKPLYKFGGLGATAGPALGGTDSLTSSIDGGRMAYSSASSPYGRGIPIGGLKSTASPYGGSAYSGNLNYSASTLGSTGLPPVPYKAYLTEHRDEYREPVEHLDTLNSLTVKFNTLGGTRVTKRSTRSDGQPTYETRVVAF